MDGPGGAADGLPRPVASDTEPDTDADDDDDASSVAGVDEDLPAGFLSVLHQVGR